MTLSNEGSLVFGMGWQGQKIPVREFIEFSRDFLLSFEAVSPLQRPFDATGPKKELANLKIAKDFSDFEEIVLKTLSADKMKYIKSPDDGNYTVSLDSISRGTCSIHITDFPIRKLANESVTIMFSANSSRLKKIVHGISIQVPYFRPKEVNEAWGEASLVRDIVTFLVEYLNPVYVSVIRSDKTFSVLERGVDNYSLGWISYTNNIKFVSALSGISTTRAFKNGILIDLGESINTLDDPETDKKVLNIRDRLRTAGATDWLNLDD